MKTAKQKLHDLVDLIPENETYNAINIIEDFVHVYPVNKLSDICKDPFIIEGSIEIPNREERNRR